MQLTCPCLLKYVHACRYVKVFAVGIPVNVKRHNIVYD